MKRLLIGLVGLVVLAIVVGIGTQVRNTEAATGIANAFVSHNYNVVATDGSTITLSFDVYFIQTGNVVGLLSAPCTISLSNTPNQVNQAVTTCVQTALTEQGYTVAKSDLLVPSFNRGN